MITKEDILKAVSEPRLACVCRYEDTSGKVWIGAPVSEIASRLRDNGWRNVGRIDASDLRKLGLTVLSARYVSGVRAKRFCDVVVAQAAPD
ncbi:MAG: hypothetical protein NW206_20040 [Hyphomonadaceae bacterium]|nr:hypothetical protein [Hyphomonadaceae bacterium]